MRRTADIFGIPLDSATMEEALEKVKTFLNEGGSHAARAIYTPNSEIIMAAIRDQFLKQILCEADLLVADGAGVVLASRILGAGLPEKVSGIDLVRNLLSSWTGRPLKLFLLGGKPGVAEAAGQNMLSIHKNIEITGTRHGYFSQEDESRIIEDINLSHADLLLVALGAPKQEKWIHEHRNTLNVKVCMGIGGTLDVYAGTAKLAPEFLRRNGLEWLYRLCREPRRFRRMLDLPRFFLLVLLKRLGINPGK
jgi:N-acetylglucosaminyldiphosphoundecaprenol N-acetyl-beta-D-mannosaminyltransferase